MSTSQNLSSVRNALRILVAFSRDEPILGVSEIARRLEVSKSTVHRTLQTLLEEEFVRRTEDGRYALGPKIREIGCLMVEGRTLRDVATPVMEHLRDETGETVHLSVLEGTEVVYVHRAGSLLGLTLVRQVGFRMPAHSTSSGKVILAFSPPEVVEEVIAAGLPRVASDTLITEDALRDALARIRQDGFVVSANESEEGAVSVGAPIFDHRERVAGALTVAGAAQRLTAVAVRQLTGQVTEAARAISVGLGWPATSSTRADAR